MLFINSAQTQIGYLIQGNLKGGFTSTPLPPPTVNESFAAPPPPPLFSGGGAKPAAVTVDPIDLFTGDTYQANDDLATIVHQLKTSAATFSYAYNQVGQRTQAGVSDDRYLSRPTANDNVSYSDNNLNQYTVVGGASITYDTNGNLTGDGTNSYTYDSENRIGQSARRYVYGIGWMLCMQ